MKKIWSIVIFFLVLAAAAIYFVSAYNNLGGGSDLGGGSTITTLPLTVATSTNDIGVIIPPSITPRGGRGFIVGNSTTTKSMTIGSLLNCDTIDTDTNGLLKCGTDATGGGGGTGSNWLFGTDQTFIYPSTTVGLIVQASSTITNLVVSDSLSGGGFTDAWNSLYNATTTLNGFSPADYVPYTGATAGVDLGNFDLNAGSLVSNTGDITGTLGVNFYNGGNDLYKFNAFSSGLNAILDISAITTADKTFTFPDQSGTLMLANYTGNATTTGTLNIGSLNAASCDVKSDTNGLLYCGTDATGGGGGTGSNFLFGTDQTFIYPSTTVGLIVQASSTITNLVVADSLSGAGFSNAWNLLHNATSTYPGFAAQFAGAYNATTTLSGFTNNQTNWNTAYGWGNHASAGYLTTTGVNSLINASSTIAALLCSNGQIPKSDGTKWTCGTDNSGASAGAAWEKTTIVASPANIITPTTTNASIYISGNATTTGSLTAGSTLYVQSDTGNVGIGTTNPSQMLTVGNNNQFTVSSAGAITGLTVNGLTLGLGNAGYPENIAVGVGALDTGTGNENVGVGAYSFSKMTVSHSVAIGYAAGDPDKSGGTIDEDTFIGYRSANNIGLTTGANYNTFLGAYSGQNLTTGASNVIIGYKAGKYIGAESNSFYVNNVDESTLANDKAYSLLYGTFSGTAGSLTGQQLVINGNVGIGTTAPGSKLDIKAGTAGNLLNFQSAAGAFLSAFTIEGGLLMNIASTTALRVQNGSGVDKFTVSSITGNGVFAGGVTANSASTTDTLYVGNLTGANCDVKATAGTGLLYCGTDATGGGGGSAAWEAKWTNVITPTTTAAGIFVTASSTFANILRVDRTSGGNETLFRVGSSTADVMTVLSNGNVGIGTSTPNNLLSVYEYIDFNNTDLNTKIGYQAGKNIVTGATYNTFLGYQAGFSSSTVSTIGANNNTAIGYAALYSNTTGDNNTAIGYQVLYSNTEGSSNTANGIDVLYSNTEGSSNTAIGYAALYWNTTGDNNVANGEEALYYNGTGNFNTANGNATLYYNTTGGNNTAIGYAALHDNGTGNFNTAIGENALYSNVDGSNNIAIGVAAGFYEMGSNTFYVNNIDQTSAAGDKAYSLLYGTFSGVAGSLDGQQLVINGGLQLNGNATTTGTFHASELFEGNNSLTTLQQNFWNATSTWAGFQGQFNTALNATTTLDLITLQSTNIAGTLTGDLICTDCLNATEIEDIYVLNTTDTMTGLTASYATSTLSLVIPQGASPDIDQAGEIGIDTTSGQFQYFDGTAKRALTPFFYPAFAYATSTWVGTTTIPLGPAFIAETWSGVKCFTDTGTVHVEFSDGTNKMNILNASTTVSDAAGLSGFILSTNNAFTAGEKRYVNLGGPASSPTRVSCTLKKSYDPD